MDPVGGQEEEEKYVGGGQEEQGNDDDVFDNALFDHWLMKKEELRHWFNNAGAPTLATMFSSFRCIGDVAIMTEAERAEVGVTEIAD